MLRLFSIIIILFFSTILFAEKAVENENIKKEVLQQASKDLTILNKTEVQNFFPFTGKILGNKVRIRTSPDLDSHVITQLNKNDLVLVLKEEKDFYAIKPTSNIKGYVYKNYIIDNIVEADRVNVRIEPNLDSAILTQLQNKAKIEGTISSTNNKWLEIDLPDSVSFYVAKEYITKIGDATAYTNYQIRKNEVDKLLNSAYFITQAECKKPFDEMVTADAINQFDIIIKEYNDFPQHVEQAKQGLTLLQDNYLQKKIVYLETKSNVSTLENKEYSEEIAKIIKVENENPKPINLTDKMKFWEPVENSLFTTWTSFHPEKKLKDFYKEQEINSIVLNGIIESYSQTIKNKPGDFIVLKDDATRAYLYSTKVDLDKFVGKKVILKVCPRPNNNFAFPAFFVNSVEVQ